MTLAPPEELRLGDVFHFTYPTQPEARFTVERFREASGEIKAELTVTAGGRHMHWSTFNLSSSSARSRLAGDLQKKWDAFDWTTALEQICVKAVRGWRCGSPFVDLSTVSAPPSARFLIPPFIPLNERCIIFGDGEGGKSLILDCLSVSLTAAIPFAGKFEPEQTGPVIYLDWETNEYEHAIRIRRVAVGMGLVRAPAGIIYRQCIRPLAEDVEVINEQVAREGAVAVMVDSLAPACGGDPSDAQAAIATMNALRAFQTTAVAIGHINRDDRDNPRANQTVFGSIFWRNMARAMWQVMPDHDPTPGQIHIDLYDRKENNAQRRKWPIGIRFSFEGDEGPISLELDDTSTHDAVGASYAERIRRLLGKHGRLGTDSIAEMLGIEEAVAKTTLHRMKDTASMKDPEEAKRKLWFLRGVA